MIITISGTPGSGKSTVGRELAKRLKFNFYSIGDLRRKMAFQRGLTLEELNRLGESQPFTDKEADDYIRLLAKEEDDFILDSRLGFYFIPNSIKILIVVSFEEGAKRIFNDLEESKERNEADYKNYEETLLGIQNRVKSDIKRFKKYYSIKNCYDKGHFDFVVDSTKMTVDQTIDKVYEFVMQKMEKKE